MVAINTEVFSSKNLTIPFLEKLNADLDVRSPGYDYRWLQVLKDGLQYEPFCIVTKRSGTILGALQLHYVKSRLFGRYLVSSPYVNVGGINCIDDSCNAALIAAAVDLANKLDVDHLQLRHEQEYQSASFNGNLTYKVHMRLSLQNSVDQLRASLKSKVRSQVKKSESCGLSVCWGTHQLLDDFYQVFARNMRDLGTPVYGKGLFRSVLEQFGNEAEICVLKDGQKPAAAALLIHGSGTTEVPSASTIREYNKVNANMYMYYQLLSRAVERGQEVFDFGRSSKDSGTYKFKKQWGAVPTSSFWQYYLRRGSLDDLRPENKSFEWKIKMWKKLPVWLTRMIGPGIVRGIP